jgi:hypothetical protein
MRFNILVGYCNHHGSLFLENKAERTIEQVSPHSYGICSINDSLLFSQSQIRI